MKKTQVGKSIIGCNCKKSKCLKLYCECFAAQERCKDTCNCSECNNNDQYNVQVQQAVKSLLQKNPDAFQSKILKTNVEQEVQDVHIKGCTCKKSKCKKKYCECFGAGIKCTLNCKCTNCRNGRVGNELYQQNSDEEDSFKKYRSKVRKLSQVSDSNKKLGILDVNEYKNNDQEIYFQENSSQSRQFNSDQNSKNLELSEELN